MRFAQEKKGQKLHLVYDLGQFGLSQPVCGRKVSGYRMTINVPMRQACGNCLRRMNSKSFDSQQFINQHFNK